MICQRTTSAVMFLKHRSFRFDLGVRVLLFTVVTRLGFCFSFTVTIELQIYSKTLVACV